MTPRPKTPGIVYSILALIVLVLVASFALTNRQPPPPTIAEFAPQAVEQITKAPDDQSSHSGADGGIGTGALAETPTPPPSEPPVQVIRVRHCVGDPPRQTEDPQSPPCVPYWSGNNGGATSKGVTRDEIGIAVPWIAMGPGQGQAGLSPIARAFETFFNKRFEFYGRKLKLVKLEGGGSSNGEAPQQQADAVTADEQLHAFASTPYGDAVGTEYYYYDELARRGLFSVAGSTAGYEGEAEYAAHEPYEWGVHPGVDVVATNMAAWICRQLNGRAARYAGPALAGGTRVFGLLYNQKSTGERPDLRNFKDALAACGIRIQAEAAVWPYAGPQAEADAQGAIIKLKNQNVTSVISFMHPVPLVTAVMPAANNQGYIPEWLVSSLFGTTDQGVGLLAPKSQIQHAFGINFVNKWNEPQDMPATWAAREIDPSLAPNGGDDQYLYWPLLVLASGIQMAGPKLTPQSFKAALQRTIFPNPNHGAPPYYQGGVSFGPKDHTFFDDTAVQWWSNTAHSTQGPASGSWCYALHGQRYRPDAWPADELELFAGDCY